MFPNKLIYEMTVSTQHRCLYHFTDIRNLETISRFGILSKDELDRRGLAPVAPGGNSWEWDRHIGISNYVSLCFTDQHPMCFQAKREGRIGDSRFLRISSRVVQQEGVLFCAGVANRKDAVRMPLRDAEEHCDVEIIYKWTDWRDPVVLERLKIARKYEILVPRMVNLDLITGI